MIKAYLASPYSHHDKKVREKRFESANKAAAKLIKDGYAVFAPISMSHPISQHMGNSNDSLYWVSIDLEWLRCCDVMFVLMIDGWLESNGVKREIDEAIALNIKVKYLDGDCFGI